VGDRGIVGVGRMDGIAGVGSGIWLGRGTTSGVATVVRAGVGVARGDSGASVGCVGSSGEEVPAGVQAPAGVDGGVLVFVPRGASTAVGETVAADLVLRRRGKLTSRCAGLVLPQMNADTEQHRQIRQYRPTRTA
jgi:hypothetical protein